MINIAVFASGAGSNAKKIIDYFKDHQLARVALIVCNNPRAGVLAIAHEAHIPSLIIQKEQFFRGDAYVAELCAHNINFIVLAGFLWKVPPALIASWTGKIINIHPALLPKYGGKGMYGHYVHEAVIVNGEKESGITVHYVDELYDHGNIIFQVSCSIDETDTPDSLAQKIHRLEHENYAPVIEKVIQLQNHR